MVDSRTPGYDQLGTVWLPLPHVLMLPFVSSDNLWRGGLAGAIPSAVCFVLAGTLLFAAARRLFHSTAAAFTTLALFALNRNVLYLQSVPMTESVLFLGLFGLLYGMVVFEQTQSWGSLAGAALGALVAALTRYEGWFLLPFVTAFFLYASRRRRLLHASVFGLIAALAPLYWLAHNAWYYGDPLAFYRGEYSAQAIYRRALAEGMARYAGDHDWSKALLYYRTDVQLCVGWGCLAAAGAGLLAALRYRIAWPLLFLALPPVFYLWSIHSSGTPIFVPQLWPSSYYNTRYGLSAVPLVALCGGAAVLLVPARLRVFGSLLVVAASLALLTQSVCWKESEVNSRARRAWTQEAARFLSAHYRPGAGIFSALGDLAGIYREAGIPLREILHQGNNPQWDAAVARPDLFLHERWAVAIAGDTVASTILKASQRGARYERVRQIIVPDAPVIEIYRRTGP